MIETNATVVIKSVNESHDSLGSLITYGIAEFSYRGKDGAVIDEISYRAKGIPAVDIKCSGGNSQGIATGYIDLQVNEREGYKEKVASLVIRGFISTGKIIQELVQFESTKEETPDFAQELLEENISSDSDEELSEVPAF